MAFRFLGASAVWLTNLYTGVAALDEHCMVQAHLHQKHQKQPAIPPTAAEERLPASPTMQPQTTVHSFGSVPVYGYDRAQEDQEEWMVMFPNVFQNSQLHEFCANLSAPAKCMYVGHPSHGGLAYVSIKGFEPEVSACVGKLDGPRFVELDGPTRLLQMPPFSTEPVPWGLDRIDNRVEGMDGQYSHGEGGKGVHIYHFDTGIKTTMADFEGRAIPTIDIDHPATLVSAMGCKSPLVASASADFVCANDKQGHGTHTAGTIGGKLYGVAKQATIHAIKILNDKGYGSWSSFMRGIDWIMANGEKPAVMSASLGGNGKMYTVEEALDAAVNAGITVVVAAGNDNIDSCTFTPAFVRSVISVGATDKDDREAYYSNWGSCVDVFAPGSNIRSLSINFGSGLLSGTSMSAPHVAGAAALILGANPQLSPHEVKSLIVSSATQGVIIGAHQLGTPNRLLYVGETTPSAKFPKIHQQAAVQTEQSLPLPIMGQAAVQTEQSLPLPIMGHQPWWQWTR